MATNDMRPFRRPRSDSIESCASLWEKTHEGNRQTQQDAPFATDADEDCLDQYPSIDDYEPIDSDADSAVTSSSVISNNQAEVWEDATLQDHLIIIINGDSNFDKLHCIIKDDLSKQGFKWKKEEEEVRPWHFGLTAIRLEFPSPRMVDIPLYMFASRVPNWIKLKSEKEQRKKKDNVQEKPMLLKLLSHLDISLRYGGFTELNEFRHSPEHSWENEDLKWSLKLGNQRNGIGFMEWLIEEPQVRRKKQLLATNVNECVILDPDERGFNIYIWQKCNMGEFEANAEGPKNFHRSGSTPQSTDWHGRSQKESEQYKSLPPRNSRPRRPPPLQTPNNNKNPQPRPTFFGQYRRVGNHPPGCYFSIVQFGVHINPVRLQPNDVQNTRKEIRQTLITLIDFFRKSKISICYGKINTEMGPEPRLYLLPSLSNFQHLSPHIPGKLYRSMDIAYKFVLINAFSIVYMIYAELNHAIIESKKKQDHVSYDQQRSLDSIDSNEVYIPAVTITPTTIRVKPLKLCRTNRVLRAKEFGKPVEHFVLVDIRDENGSPLQAFHFQDLHEEVIKYLRRDVDPRKSNSPTGFTLMADDRQYHYLHHSQSQLRERQFWFYHHDPKGSNYSHEKAYEWMGNFDGEPNPAKRAARIALCFSTTKETVMVPRENVGEEREITTPDGKLIFTDGCGRMSLVLRNQIKRKLHLKRDFSAVQFRYGGVKGVVSVYDDMPEGIDLGIRRSMQKFTSPHECFEMCKLSAPRRAFLNRQAIMLLSYRKIPDTSFLILQQKSHLALILALLRNDDAEKLILQKIPDWLLPPDIHTVNIDYIHEPFFRQLLISACLQSVKELLHRTRIRIPSNEGRNMIGIVDEYNVLEPDEVYIQYTILDDKDNRERKKKGKETEILDNRRVVITKNPCHHPGDIRTFTAVNHPKLRDLKDVIVFSQRGERPAPHDISGSDLDGDEYLVVWHEDLVPQNTPNASPYDYDGNTPTDPPPPSVTREVINETVLRIAEQDCLGRLSNLHLVFADRFGIDNNQRNEQNREVMSTMELAGAISHEVDSPKTGYHPVNEDAIQLLNKSLGNERPDYIDKSGYELRQSKHVLGKRKTISYTKSFFVPIGIGQLYRASKKTLRGWNRLVQYHRHLRHLQVRTNNEPEDEEELDDDQGMKIDLDTTFFDGLEFNEGLYSECIVIAGELAFVYRQEMLEILSLYGLSHESDLWCRNSSAGISGELEDTAYSELEQLVKRTKNLLHLKSVGYCLANCDEDTYTSDLCVPCRDRRQATAIACYKNCYSGSNSAEQAPILSLPWVFVTPLVQNRLNQTIPLSTGLLTTAMKNNLNLLIDKRKDLLYNGQCLRFERTTDSSVCKANVDIPVYAFIEILGKGLGAKKYPLWPFVLSRFVRSTSTFQRLDRQRMSTDEWILKSTPPSTATADYQKYCDQLLSIDQPETDSSFHDYVTEILSICFDEARVRNDEKFLDVSEQIILLLQRMAINETIV